MICIDCGEDKPLTEYYKYGGKQKGYRPRCKPCNHKKNKSYEKAPRKNRPWRQRTKAAQDWDKTHRAQARARQKKYYDTKRKFQPRDPEYTRAYVNRRRARKVAAEGSHTVQEWRDLCLSIGGVCVFPGCESTVLTRDHIIPLALGGPDSIDNIQPLCQPHNSQKGLETIDYLRLDRAAFVL